MRSFLIALRHQLVVLRRGQGNARSAASRRSPALDRFIGSIRRECLDHVIIFSVCGLCRILDAYIDHYERSRTHRARQRSGDSARSHGNRTRARSLVLRGSAASILGTNGAPPDLGLVASLTAAPARYRSAHARMVSGNGTEPARQHSVGCKGLKQGSVCSYTVHSPRNSRTAAISHVE